MNRRGTFAGDYRWQLRFQWTIRKLVGPLLLEPAPLTLDQEEATDFLVFNAADKRLAARVRRKGYAEQYSFQFTIRSRRDNGARTEFAKIIRDGYGNWLFYGHYTGFPWAIHPWWLIDLDVFRHLYSSVGRQIACEWHKPNGDGTYFHAFDLREILRRWPRPSADLIVAGEHEAWTDEATLNVMTDGRRVVGDSP